MMHRSRVRAVAALLLGAAALFFILGTHRLAWAQIKLYMKDGSYQLVESYEVRGSRVRYYSVERSEWEEVPKSLVDFQATQKAQTEAAATKQKSLEDARELDKQRFEKPEETGFEIAPGIRLPKDEGVFAFDGTRAIPMIQSSAEVVTDKKRKALLLALPGPLVKNRALVVLPGAKAAIRLSVSQPVFYVQFQDNPGAHIELISVKPGKESRLIEKIPVGIGLGTSDELRASLPVERAAIAPGLFSVRPLQALAPGEYALAELLQQKLNLELWDFGIEAGSRPARVPPPTGTTPSPQGSSSN